MNVCMGVNGCIHRYCMAILMALYKRDVTPLLTHWSYVSFTRSHQFIPSSHDASPPIPPTCSFCNIFNTLRPRQDGRHFADDTFNRIFLNDNVRISIKISLKFVPKGPINNNPSLVQIMAWCRSGDKPLSEPMMVSLLTHVCVTRPQWVNAYTTCPIFHEKKNDLFGHLLRIKLFLVGHHFHQH